MEPNDQTLEEKIANIKTALKELGESLENEEKPSLFSPSLSKTPISPQHNSSASFKPPNSQKLDLATLYTYEKERNSMLEVRISHKDELLSEMTLLQNELYSNIEDLQNTVESLRSDLIYFQKKNQELSAEIESHSSLLRLKDEEISRISEEKEKYFSYLIEKNEESKLLSEEISAKEPDKRLILALEKRNQELLLEINNLQHNLHKINTNQFQVIDLKEKLISSEEELEKIVKSHAGEVCGLLNRINNLESQLLKKSTEDNQKKITQMQDQNLVRYKKDYNELVGLLEVTDGNHQEALEKINELLCKSLESTRLSAITDNLCDQLGVQADQIVGKVRGMQEGSKMAYRLYEKLAELMVQCSPKGRFSDLPSCQQVWKWVTRVLEDYMVIRKEGKV